MTPGMTFKAKLQEPDRRLTSHVVTIPSAVVTQAMAAAKGAGIPLGSVGLSAEQASALFGRGYRVICGFDAIWLKAKTAEAQAWTLG